MAAIVLTDQLITGRYRLRKLLGSGGFGAVYLAEDTRLQRPVAIKVCSTQSLPQEEAQEAASLFQSEALTLARLRHPGLTAVWDYFYQGNDWYLVMEYVPGETLREVLRQAGGQLPVDQALDYIRQICEVLRYLHTQPVPVIFRDLKPANIMITPLGELKLIDFGIARLFSPGKTSDTFQFGTPGYAPPEQYGGQTEPRSDIYSLAVVAHQMLTGHNPLASAFVLPPARIVNPSLSPQIEAALLRATAQSPADRFANVDDFCTALQQKTGSSRSKAGVPILFPIRSEAPSVPLRSEPNSRPLWTPAPRSLPRRPPQGSMLRGIILVCTLFLLLAALAMGLWMMRAQATTLWKVVREQPAPPSPGISVPGMVAYIAPGPKGGDDLYIRTGTSVRRLTENLPGIAASLPAISPDRRQIAFGIFHQSKEELWLINRDGSNLRQLLTQYSVARAPSWSPDGKRLLVEVARAGQNFKQHDIIALTLLTGDVTPILNSAGWEGGPAWSPNGHFVAFNGRLEGSQCMRIYIYDMNQHTTREATSPPSNDECVAGQGDFWPAWSPDGTRLAFGRKYDNDEHIAVLNIANGEVFAWDSGPSPAGHPRWSPDGRYLLFQERSGERNMLERLDLTTRKIEALDPTRPGTLADWR